MLDSIITKVVISSNKGVYVYADCPYCLTCHCHKIGTLRIDPFLKLGVHFPNCLTDELVRFESPNLRLVLNENTVFEGKKKDLQSFFQDYRQQDKHEYGIYLNQNNSFNADKR